MPSVNRRSWLAWYLQHRRRHRLAEAAPPPLLGDDLVAHFSFEESNADRTDDVDGYVLETFVADVASAPALLGDGAAFDGTGYLCGTTPTTVFSPTSTGFTVSLWVNFAGIPDPFSDAYLVSVWDDANWPSGSSWHMWANPDGGDIHAQVMGTGWAFLDGTADLAQWTHICLVYEPDGGRWRFYINGALASSVNFDYSAASGTPAVGGHTNFVATPPEGLFDELAVWSRALSATEVATLYNNGAGLAYPY